MKNILKNKIKKTPVIGQLAKLAFKFLRNPRHTFHYLKGKMYCIFHEDYEVRLKDNFRVTILTDSTKEYNNVASDLAELPVLETIVANLSPEDIIYDVGAFIGLHTLFYAKKAKEVHAFEPSPNNMQRLKENAKHNSIANIRYCEKAVSDTDGNQVFFRETGTPLSGQNSLCKSALSGRTFVKQTVPTITLDSYSFSYSTPDVIKLDIEGGEFKALKGAINLLRGKSVLLFIELHLSKSGSFNESDVYALLDELNYQVVDILQRGESNKHIMAFPSKKRENIVLPATNSR